MEEREEHLGDHAWGSGADPWQGGTGAVGEWLRRNGGVATRQQLLDVVTRGELDDCLGRGRVRRVARGRYVLDSTGEDVALAHGVGGVLSHASAAVRHGWPVLLVDERVHVTVARGSRAQASAHPGLVLHRADLHDDEVQDGVTSPHRTLVDCLRNLPVRQTLAVADSALRAGMDPQELLRIAAALRGRGAARARRVAAEANRDAANPFESALRAVSLDVAGLLLRPQVALRDEAGTFLGRPDLVDEALRLVVEADSFEWHGSRSALVRDARRYNALTVAGWRVLRFTWEDVVLRPEEVAQTLTHAAQRRSKVARAAAAPRFRAPLTDVRSA